MSRYLTGGTDLDALFDPDTVGDGTAVAFYVGGTPLRYANIKYGSKRADVGYKNGGTDVSNYWAAKGTAVYNLGFNGRNYTASNNLRGTATIKLYMLNDGTWQIHRIVSSTETGIDSGVWLPAGDSVANWSCNMGVSQTGTSVGNASHSTANSAPGVTALTTTQTASATSSAILVTTQGVSNGQITVILYRLGVQRSASTFNYQTSAFGN
ncbi:hypothetical protein ACVWWJ_003800 [Luteibacter sp. HA06]